MYIDLSPSKRIMVIMTAIIVALIIAVVCLVVALNGKSDPMQEVDNEVIETVGPRFRWYDGGHGNFERIYIDTETGVLYVVWHDTMGTTWGSVIMGADGLPVLGEGYERKGD